MPERPALHFPDDLAESRRKLTFIAVDDHLKLKDATMTVDLDHVTATSSWPALFAYVPEHTMIIEGDIATAAEDLSGGDSWLDNIGYRKLTVLRNVPVHTTPMTKDEVIKMVNGGIHRATEVTPSRSTGARSRAVKSCSMSASVMCRCGAKRSDDPRWLMNTR